MARRFTRSRFVRPAPRTKIWIGAGVGLTTITASAVQVVATLSAGGLLLRPFTILRTRMEVWFGTDQSAAAEDPQGDLGEIIVSDQAVAAGAASIPDPSAIDGDPDADWYIHQPVTISYQILSSVGFVKNLSERYTIDSKAMRKVGANEDSALMFSETGGHGALLYTRGRQLIQLH